MEEEQKSTRSILTNKRLTEIKNQITRIQPERVDEIIEVICKVMKFDPEYSKYISERAKARAKEKGVTLYEYNNAKNYYEKNKEALNKKRVETRKLKQQINILKENI